MHFLFLFGLFIVLPAFFDWCLLQNCLNMWIPLLVLIPCIGVLAYSEYKSSQAKKEAEAKRKLIETMKKMEQTKAKNERFVIEEDK